MNVVLIVADDLGYRDLGVQGMVDIKTPNIDAIAREGVRFTDAYMVSTLCSVSRGGILTGRYPMRWGQEFNPDPSNSADSSFGIPRNVPTLAEQLRSLGYRTGIFGKWHLGYVTDNLPTSRGFDDFYGFIGASHRYNAKPPFTFGQLLRGTTPVKEKGPLTDAFAREAVRFIGENAARPFFLYVPFNAVHAPLEGDAARMDRVKQITDPERRTYAAVLVAMDDAVGRIMQAIDDRKLRERTLVIFASDNGGPTKSTTSSNRPLRGIKGMVYEGGIRVPFLMRWPGHIRPASTYALPVSSMDILPTAVVAAGAKSTTGVDGVDLLPFLSGARTTSEPHRQLFWRYGDQSAVREGRWKMVKLANRPTQLYDLAVDVQESTNVALGHPDVVRRLEGLYATWATQMKAPRWGHEEHFVDALLDVH